MNSAMKSAAVGSSFYWYCTVLALVFIGPTHAAVAEEAAAVAATDEGKAPKLRCDAPEFTFEEVWSGDEVEHTFIIHNDGDAELEILNVKPSCGCTVAGEHDKKIAPGASGKIPLKINTKNMRGDLTKTTQISHNDPTADQPFQLTIKGPVKARIDVDPVGGANFGQVTTETDLVRTVTVTNNTDTKMMLAEKADNHVTDVFSYEMKELEEGKKVEFSIKAKRPAEEGVKSHRYVFTTGIEEEPEIYINSYLFARPLVEVQPAWHAFRVPLDKEWTNERVYITNNTNEPLKIEEVTPSHPQIKTELTEEETGKKFRLAVRIEEGFDPPASDPVKIVLKTNVPDKPEVEVNFRLARAQAEPKLTAESLIGQAEPTVIVKDTDDKDVKLGGANDAVRVVNFWASWCGYCKKQMPVLQKIASTYEKKGVEFLMVSTDQGRPKEEVLKVAESIDVKLPIAFDAKHSAMKLHGVSGFPTLFVVDKGGVIRAVHRGARPDLEESLTKQLDALLEGKVPDVPALAAGVATPAPDAPAKPSPSAALAFDSRQQDTGEHKPGADVHYKLYYRNDGSLPLEVTKVSGSKGVEVLSWDKEVAAGGNGSAEVHFDAPGESMDFSHSVTFESNDPQRKQQTVVLTGTVKPFLQLDPIEGVDFGSRVPTHSMPRLATIIYNGDEPVKYLKAESSSPKFDAEVKLIQNGPNAMVIVKSNPPFEPGRNEGIVTVTSDCKQQPQVIVPVQLFMPPPIDVAPAEIELAKQSRLQKESVKITNNTGKSMHILGIEKSDPKIITQFYPEPDGLSYSLELTFRKDFDCGPDGEKITIKTDHPKYGEIVIPIKMSANGRVSRAQ